MRYASSFKNNGIAAVDSVTTVIIIDYFVVTSYCSNILSNVLVNIGHTHTYIYVYIYTYMVSMNNQLILKTAGIAFCLTYKLYTQVFIL